MSTSKRFIQQTIDEMTGLIDNAALNTRVAWVRDLPDRVTVDGREEHAVAIWRTASDDGANRSDSVSSWLRRAGVGRVLNRLGTVENAISLPRPERSRGWLKLSLVECDQCHQIIERRSPIQRHCRECRQRLKGDRSREAMRRCRT
jgi:hypothetical protein